MARRGGSASGVSTCCSTIVLHAFGASTVSSWLPPVIHEVSPFLWHLFRMRAGPLRGAGETASVMRPERQL